MVEWALQEPAPAAGALRQRLADAPRRWVMLPLVLVALGLLLLRDADTTVVFSNLALQALLQVGSMGVAGLVVTVAAAAGFLATGSVGLLLLGCGALAFAASGVLPMLGGSDGVNIRVTLHNLCIWVSAMLHFVGVALAPQTVAPPRRSLVLAAAQAASLLLLLLATWAVFAGVTPPFFHQGGGGTPLRQAVLICTLLLLATTCIFLLRRDAPDGGRSASAWYATGLALVALAVVALLQQRAVGSAIGWLGVVAQWVSALWLLAAAWVSAGDRPQAAALPLVRVAADPWLHYALAPVFVSTTVVCRLVFFPSLGNAAPFDLFFPAVLLAALVGGWGPASLALLLSLAAGGWFWAEPAGLDIATWTIDSQAAAVAFGAVSLLLTLLALWMQSARARLLAADYDRRIDDLTRHSDQALRRNQARHRQLVDSVDQGVCVCQMLFDADGEPVDYRFLETNAAFAPLSGLPADAAGRSARELAPGRARRWVRRLAPVVLDRRTLRFDDDSIAPGRWLEVVAAPLDLPGQFMLLLGDATERHARQQHSARAAARDRFALQLSDALRPLDDPQALLHTAARLLRERLQAARVVYVDVGGGTVAVEGAALQRQPPEPASAPLYFGRMLMDALGLGRSGVLADVANDAGLEPAERAAFASIGVAASIGVPVHVQGRLVAGLAVHASQPRAFGADEVDLAEDTAQQAWVAVERARSQAALRRSEEDFRLLGEALPAMLWMSDADGRMLYRNAAWREFSGRSSDGAGDPNWRTLLHPDDRERVALLWRQSRDGGQAFEAEFRCRRGDGVDRWLLVRIVPVLDASRALRRWIGVATDVHDRVLSEQALQEADRRKDQFLAMLAHELRNPLAPIRSAVDVIGRLAAGQPAVLAAQAVIARQSAHMTRLVSDLLDVSRITRDLVALQRVPLDLAAVLASAVETAGPLLQARRQVLAQRLPEAPLPLLADPTRLAQVFANLLDNAAKYSAPGGRITLAARRAGSQVVVTVQDQGIGIPPALQERVFELFEQGDADPQRSRGGLGIGLTLVRRLVELHGGTVGVSSAGTGQGSCFTVRLPLAPADEPAMPAAAPVPDLEAVPPAGAMPATAPAVPAPPDAAPPGPCVLVVDDNRDAADTLAQLLALSGHRVQTAYDGPQALSLAEAQRPAVVLLDLGMPGMDGCQTAQALRRQAWGRDVLLVATTGWGQAHDIARTRAAGFDHHLVKPVDPQALLALVDQRLSRDPQAAATPGTAQPG